MGPTATPSSTNIAASQNTVECRKSPASPSAVRAAPMSRNRRSAPSAIRCPAASEDAIPSAPAIDQLVPVQEGAAPNPAETSWGSETTRTPTATWYRKYTPVSPRSTGWTRIPRTASTALRRPTSPPASGVVRPEAAATSAAAR